MIEAKEIVMCKDDENKVHLSILFTNEGDKHFRFVFSQPLKAIEYYVGNGYTRELLNMTIHKVQLGIETYYERKKLPHILGKSVTKEVLAPALETCYKNILERDEYKIGINVKS